MGPDGPVDEYFELLVEELTTIPECPRLPGALQGIVRKLRQWCCGAVVNGQKWTPAQQARWLVDEAEMLWPAWRGLGALYELFTSRFPVAAKSSNGPAPKVSPAEAHDVVMMLRLCRNFPADLEPLEQAVVQHAPDMDVALRVVKEFLKREHCPNAFDLGTACAMAGVHADLRDLLEDVCHPKAFDQLPDRLTAAGRLSQTAPTPKHQEPPRRITQEDIDAALARRKVSEEDEPHEPEES